MPRCSGAFQFGISIYMNYSKQLLLPVLLGATGMTTGRAADPSSSPAALSDPYLNLLMQKGIITSEEARKAEAEVQARQHQLVSEMSPMESKWKIGKAIKSIELFGDIRLRYEYREAATPVGDSVRLDRGRYSVRFGLRGEALDDFYYGLRLDTAANPRSAWLTFGSSSSGIPYQGPYGKSTAGLNLGLAYLGWRPWKGVDVTLGKMANPLYTTSMVWDSDLNPEGAAERFNYTIGQAELFANFGQFLYQNPSVTSADTGLLGLGSFKQNNDLVFQFAWQGGVKYNIDTNTWAKIGATLYHYTGLQRSGSSIVGVAPYLGDPFVGEGAYAGAGSGYTVNGFSGYGISNSLLGYQSYGYPNNQVGLNHLVIVDVPFELNFKVSRLDAQVFGDVAYSLEGKQRAQDAANAYANFLTNGQPPGTTSSITPFAPQADDCKAYQFGFAIGGGGGLDLINGKASRKHAWGIKTYWQHVEQYALDPNLLDSDFFEGRGNLEGIYGAVGYGFSDNLVGTFRYGYAHRINDKLGTGGSNQDIPQINPIDNFNLMQLDLSYKF